MRRERSGTNRWVVLLACLPWANLATAEAQQPIVVESQAAQAADDRILAILQTPFSGKFEKKPLTDVLAGIARSTSLPIHVDAKALADAHVARDVPVSCKLSGDSLRIALGLILKPLKLTWTIHDECLLVTTPERANHWLIIKVYPVRDLITFRDASGEVFSNYSPLIQLIADSVEPITWSQVGGPAEISFLEASGSLIIYQSREVHPQIAMLLAALRQARDAQPIAIDPPIVRPHGARHLRPRETAEPPRFPLAPGMGGGMF